MEEQENFRKIILKDKKNFQATKSIILATRNNMLRMPEVVLEAGVTLLKKFKGNLGEECTSIRLID